MTEFDGKQLKYTTKDGLGTEDGEHSTLQVLQEASAIKPDKTVNRM